jgi:hypothetical protein
MYKNFTRMHPSDYELLINLIGPKIFKTDTVFRKEIPVQERLKCSAFWGFQITSLFLYSSIKCIMHSLLHSIQSINTESRTEERTLVMTIHSSWEAQRDATRARPDWHHCNACPPFDATGEDRQVSEHAVGYHRMNILKRKDDTGIRNKSGPGLRHQLSSLEAWMFVYVSSVLVLSCAGSDLARGWSPVQGVVPTDYKIKKLKWKEFSMPQGSNGKYDWMNENITDLWGSVHPAQWGLIRNSSDYMCRPSLTDTIHCISNNHCIRLHTYVTNSTVTHPNTWKCSEEGNLELFSFSKSNAKLSNGKQHTENENKYLHL